MKILSSFTHPHATEHTNRAIWQNVHAAVFHTNEVKVIHEQKPELQK